jgi:hypothetical protein
MDRWATSSLAGWGRIGWTVRSRFRHLSRVNNSRQSSLTQAAPIAGCTVHRVDGTPALHSNESRIAFFRPPGGITDLVGLLPPVVSIRSHMPLLHPEERAPPAAAPGSCKVHWTIRPSITTAGRGKLPLPRAEDRG